VTQSVSDFWQQLRKLVCLFFWWNYKYHISYHSSDCEQLVLMNGTTKKVLYHQVWLFIIRYLFSVTYTGGLASGCPSSPNAVQNSQDMISTTQTGGVRCCSLDGGSCKSRTPDCSTLTFSNAEQKCSEFGMRLCTEEEFFSKICCGTGCSFDNKLVWYTQGNLFCSTELN
jgi:hypothetical protein